MEKTILNNEDVLEMLDGLLRKPKPFWEGFYTDRDRNIPFFKVQGPDENLVEYFNSGLAPQRVLEFGCGPGRNAIYMAKKGCEVDAVDLSEKAIAWARERAAEERVSIHFECVSLFDFTFEPAAYDFVYDCGLFHHLPPHRRITYLQLLKRALKPGGHFGLVCFNTAGALATPDWEVYEERSLKGGIGYTEERLKEIFTADFNILELRKMKKIPSSSDLFGEDFLWTALMELKPEEKRP